MRIPALLRRAAPLLAFALLVGCADANNTGEGALPTLTESGLYPVLSAQPPAAEGQSLVTLSLKQVPGGIELASVQGEVEYDATTLRLGRAIMPEGVEGDAFEVSPGRIRFVGTMVQGVTEAPLLQLELSGREAPVALTREMFTVRFEEVTGGADLADLTSTVRSDRMVFVRSR